MVSAHKLYRATASRPWWAIGICLTLVIFFNLSIGQENGLTKYKFLEDTYLSSEVFIDCSAYSGLDIKNNVSAATADPSTQPAHDMVLVAKSLHNEIELINYFLYWYLHQGFRRYLVVDNESTDGTLAQVVKFKQDYHHIVELALVRQFGYQFYVKSLEPAVQLLAINLWPTASWVFVVDADEYIVSTNGLGNDFGAVPLKYNVVQCYQEQYCPTRHARFDPALEFHERLQHLSTKSQKIKAVARTNEQLQPWGGHHHYQPRVNTRCEMLQYTPEAELQDWQLRSKNVRPCPAYFATAWRHGERECGVDHVVLVRVPAPGLQSIFTFLKGKDYIQSHPTPGLTYDVRNRLLLQEKLFYGHITYLMYKSFAANRTCRYILPKSSLDQLFAPPGLAWADYSSARNQTDAARLCAAMQRFELSSADLTLVIYFHDNDVDVYQQLQWHFAIGFRRFHVLFKHESGAQTTGVQQFQREVGRFVQMSIIQLPVGYAGEYADVVKLASLFVTGTQRKVQNSWMTFFISSTQLILPTRQSLYQSLLHTSNAHQSPPCYAFKMPVVECGQTRDKSAVYCHAETSIDAHHGLLYSEFNYFQLNYTAVPGRQGYFKMSANVSALVQGLKRHKELGEARIANCSDYHISIREFPNRSPQQMITKYMNGKSRKYVKVREFLDKFPGTYQDNLAKLYNIFLQDTRATTYDPMPFQHAFVSADALRES